MTVLLLTCRDDFYVPDLVAHAVRALGHDVARVDTDLFPGAHTLSVGDDGWHVRVAGAGAIDDVSAIWSRRRWPGLGLMVEPRFHAGCAAQGRSLMAAWLKDPGCRVVNDVAAEDAAEDKVLQLRVARALGFLVPDTLVSNEPERVRGFVEGIRGQGGRVVTKLLSPLIASVRADDGFFYTHEVFDDDLAFISDVIHAPQIFQRAIDKHLELRVQVVSDDVFVGALAAAENGEPGAQDWRQQQGGVWQHHALSTTTTARCVALVRSLGLVTGAVDLLVDVDGREWFLEVNPAGEWGFLQAELGLPIAAAIARALVAEPGS